MEAEQWARLMGELGADIDPSVRRANMLLSGVSLHETRGRVLQIGGVQLIIGGETTPCERMDEALPGLQVAMKPRWAGGAFAQVIVGGAVRVGDPVMWS